MLYPVCFRRRDHMNRTVPAAYKRRNGIFDIFEKKKKGRTECARNRSKRSHAPSVKMSPIVLAKGETAAEVVRE